MLLKTGQTGVSLVEALIAMGLAGLLLTFAVPAFTALQARRAADAALAALTSDMALARSEAIKRGHSVTVCSSADGSNCLSKLDWAQGWIVYERADKPSPAAAPAASPASAALRVQGPLAGIASIAATDGALTFRPTGVGMAMAGNILVTPQADASLARLLCISSTGRIRLTEEGTTQC